MGSNPGPSGPSDQVRVTLNGRMNPKASSRGRARGRAGKVVSGVAERVLYQDIVPYEVPTSLDALHGPAAGVLELPVTVHWGSRRVFDLDRPSLRRAAYRAIVREGTTADQEALLNAHLLGEVWRELILPERCRRLWEETFPELASA